MVIANSHGRLLHRPAGSEDSSGATEWSFESDRAGVGSCEHARQRSSHADLDDEGFVKGVLARAQVCPVASMAALLGAVVMTAHVGDTPAGRAIQA